MKLSTHLAATLAALTLGAIAAPAVQAAPTPEGDYTTRAVRSPNGKDVFLRLVKVPKVRATAEAPDCPMMKDSAAMKGMCDHRMGHSDRSMPAPQG